MILLLLVTFIFIIWVLLKLDNDSAIVKGHSGELFVNQMIEQNLDTNKYYVIHNVTLPIHDGTTQIDHIIVSEFGIFVIETKNKKGWIYGSSDQKQWTQNIFGHTYTFQNPLHQNYKHSKVLQRCLGISGYYIFPVVVFVGDSVFKSRMPANITYRTGLIQFIQSKTRSIIPKEKVSQIINHINSNRLEPNGKTHKTHIEYVRKIHNTNKHHL